MKRMKLLLLISFFAIAGQQAISQKHILANMVKEKMGSKKNQLIINDLLVGDMNYRNTNADKAVKKSRYFSFNQSRAAKLIEQKEQTLSVSITNDDNEVLTLDLVAANDMFSTTKIVTASGQPFDMRHFKATFYSGVVRGQEETSIVSINIFENEITGMIATRKGNIVIGKLTGTDRHILYNDRNLLRANTFSCATKEAPLSAAERQLYQSAQARTTITMLDKKVYLYYETEYDIFQEKGSIGAVVNYITGLHSQVAALYLNEGITTPISQIRVWDVEDPYNATSSDTLLAQFQAYNPHTLNGNLGQLLTYRSVGGGIAAGFDGICNSNVANRLSISGIYPSDGTVPTYSWSVEVITHEFGHLFGSRHTHACVWNGNNTAIDGCEETEGGCPNPGYPAEGGTIMSYCDLVRGVGINFANGFGPQPGDVIRGKVNAGACLKTCAPTELPTVAMNTGNALNFDGGNDYVSIPASTTFNFGTGDFSMEAWVNFTADIPDYRFVIGHINGTNSDYVLTVIQGKVVFFIDVAGVYGLKKINDGAWHHIAAVRSAGMMYLYIDGIPDGTVMASTYAANSLGALTIGGFNQSLHFPGKIDEVRIWNIARSQADIQLAMNTGLTGTETGLAAYYNCNQGRASGINTTVNSLTDNTGKGNNGVLNNFTLTDSNSNWVAGKVPITRYSIWSGTSIQLNNAVSGTWASSNNNLATVDTKGYVSAGAQSGSANIIFTTAPNSNSCSNTTTAIITTVPLPVITGANRICKLGDSTTLTANATGGYWESSNNAVATVNPNTGVVTAKGSGTCTITYTVVLYGYKKTQSLAFSVYNVTADWSMTANTVYTFTAVQTNCTYQWYYDYNTVAAATARSMSQVLTDDYQKVGLSVRDNSSGCIVTRNTVSDTLHIHITDAAIATVSNNAICLGDVINLSTPKRNDYYYVWSTNANGTGVVSTTTTITDTPTVTTTYYVTAIDANGHAITDKGTTITVKGSAVVNSNTGNALHFDGKDYVAIPNNTNIPIGNANYSIEAWIKPDVHTFNGIVGWGAWGETKQTTAFRLGDNNTLRNGWTNSELSVTSGNLADGKWHHVAATYDGATRKIYVDGVLKGQDNATGHNVPSSSNLRIGMIGSTAVGNAQIFRGCIDEVRIWSTARTQTQIMANMNKELVGTETGLVSYYTFNHGVNSANNADVTSLADKTSNGNTGVLTNFALSSNTSNWVAGTDYTTGQIKTNKLNFDGVDDYVQVPNNAGIPKGNSTYTLEALIKPNVHGTNGIIGWGNWWTVNGVNALRLGENNVIYNYWWSNDLKVTSGNLADGVWHHIAATFDGTTRKIYVDGVLKGQDNPTGHNVTNTSNLAIGTTRGIEYFNGSLDEVRVWNIARTQSQIQGAMNIELNATDTVGLKAYYNFNQGAAGGTNTNVKILINKANKANDGTLTNFALTGTRSNWVTDTMGTTAAKICTGTKIQLNNTTIGGTWSSSNPAIATVSSTGLVTGVSAGTVVISYTVANSTSCGIPTVNTTVTVTSCVQRKTAKSLQEVPVDAFPNVYVYPNPTQGKINIQLKKGMEAATITIANALGTTVVHSNTKGLTRVIDLTGLPKGIYWVQVTDSTGMRTNHKIILK